MGKPGASDGMLPLCEVDDSFLDKDRPTIADPEQALREETLFRFKNFAINVYDRHVKLIVDPEDAGAMTLLDQCDLTGCSVVVHSTLHHTNQDLYSRSDCEI